MLKSDKEADSLKQNTQTVITAIPNSRDKKLIMYKRLFANLILKQGMSIDFKYIQNQKSYYISCRKVTPPMIILDYNKGSPAGPLKNKKTGGFS